MPFTYLQIIIYTVLIIIPLWVVYVLYKNRLKKQKAEWLSSKRYITLSLLLPKLNEKGPLSAEQMFAALHGIYKEGERWQEKISFEIISRNKFIQFYIWLPDYLKDFVEGQLYAQYPDAEIYEVNDYSAEDWQGKKIVGAELKLNKSYVYPIKTFLNFEVDPLSAITSVLGQCEDEEQIWIQLIIRPVSDDWQNKGIGYVSNLRSGKSAASNNIFVIILSSIFRLVIDILKTLFRGPTTESASPESKEVKLSAPKEAALKAVESKVTKLGFDTKIRILSLTMNEYSAKSKLEAISGAFKQFNSVNLNGFEISKLNYGRDILEAYQKREFEGRENILNIEELASIYHLPSKGVETPNIVWAGSKKGEPPSNLPIEGSIPDDDLTIFAQTNFRKLQHKFGMKRKDRRLHMYAIGKTGTGKSTMLENMIIDDIRKGKGLAVCDPHGELINHILNFIPDNRIDDVIYFNPADKDFPIGFNLLESVDPDLKNIVASGVVGIFKKIFGESWGPRLEYILRNTILALLDYPNSTLLDIMKVLTEKEYRKKVIASVKDPVIRDFFINEFEKYDPKFRTEAIAPIQNKVGQFLSSSTIRNIVGQTKSTINVEDIMNKGKILLIDLSIGRIGEDNSALLGSMLITKIQLSAMRRAVIPEDQRLDFYLYVDEFQNFVTDSFAVILSEARKYRLNLILTNQYIAQIPEVVSNAVFGNIGTMVCFRVGAQDANFLVREVEPVFTANDLVNLDNYHIYLKMAIDGVTRPAYSAITLPPVQAIEGQKANRDRIIASSREKFARNREEIESHIKQWAEETMVAKSKEDKKPTSTSSAGFKSLPTDNDYRIFTDKNNQKWYIFTKQEFKPDTGKKESLITEKELENLATKNKASSAKIKRVNKEEISGSKKIKAGESVKL